ncbi:hypothetical protein [Amycolatopsis sp. lyj-112]|uniref:hypothetical protein n=1 Tax=Amycolatopsis sp. lyj-112 TaxID=2789288 RepID=UPI00397A2123
MAASCRTKARAAGPVRAQELRDCARTFTQQALRLELFVHSKQIGQAHVTRASFRDHLRAQRT